MQKLLARLNHIILEADPSLASLLFGLSLMIWGVVALIIGNQDLVAFAGPLSNLVESWVWSLNYFLLGIGFVAVAIMNFPPTLSLITGTYACLVWTWIASLRKFPILTSGITLNVFVIIMGVLLIIRSRKK